MLTPQHYQEIKQLLKVALPLIAAFFAQKGMQFIDNIMLGWIGPQALAAGALAVGCFLFTMSFCMGTLNSVGIVIVHAKGAGNLTEIKSNLFHGICFALMLSVFCMLLIAYAPHFLIFIGQDLQVVRNSTLLFHGLILGVPGALLFMIFRELVSTFALTRIVMFVTLGSLPLTFFVNYILIYGKLGFPALGIMGIGYACSFVVWLMFFCLYIYSKYHPTLKEHVSAFWRVPFQWNKIQTMISIGFGSGMISIFDSSMFLVATFMIGYFGVDALAAHQIALLYGAIIFMIPLALSLATSLQVGHAYAKRDYQQALRFAYYGIGIGVGIAVIIAILLLSFSHFLASLFLLKSDPHYKEILQLAVSLLIIAGFLHLFDAFSIITNGALRGLKDTFIPMLLSISCYIIFGIGGGYVLAFHTPLKVQGVWYGLCLGLATAGFIFILRFRGRMRSLLRNYS